MEDQNIELLRFTTAGSVDEVKAPLLGDCCMIVNLFFKTS